MKMCRRKHPHKMKEVLACLKDDIASIRKMKQLSPKTKIKVEDFHKKGGKSCYFIQTQESWRQERSVIDGYISCCRATHAECWGHGVNFSEWFQSKCQLLRDLSQLPALLLVATHSTSPAALLFILHPVHSFKALSTLLFPLLQGQGYA